MARQQPSFVGYYSACWWTWPVIAVIPIEEGKFDCRLPLSPSVDRIDNGETCGLSICEEEEQEEAADCFNQIWRRIAPPKGPSIYDVSTEGGGG